MLTLGIDAGGTATRWVLLDAAADRVVARGETGGCSGHIFDPAVRRRAEAAFAAILEGLGPHRPQRIAGGLTGLGGGTPEAATMAGWLASPLGLDPAAVDLGDDLWLAAASLFAPGEGGVIYAGTGSIGYAIDAAGQAVVVGGRGVIVDDAGGAFWIAAQGLRAVMRAVDEDPAAALASPLGAALAARLGDITWPAVRAHVYAADRGGVGALASFVAQAATDGDPAAQAILQEAGRELSRLGRVLVARLGSNRLALAGGAFRLHPLIGRSLRDALPSASFADAPDLDAALAAARLAAQGRRAPHGT